MAISIYNKVDGIEFDSGSVKYYISNKNIKLKKTGDQFSIYDDSNTSVAIGQRFITFKYSDVVVPSTSSADLLYEELVGYLDGTAPPEIGDNGTPALNKFGALSALTNGVAFYWDTQTEPLYELHEGIKTNKEFIRIASDTGAIGTGTEAYLADVSGGGTEKSYLPNIDMEEIYGFNWGLRLRKGTLDKLIFRIQDNLTGLTTFNAIATGTRI